MKRLSEVAAHPIRDRVYQRLKEAILTGKFAPGERLLETELADEMGVSRTPVREAVRRLEREGLVVWRPFRGAEVVGIPYDVVEQLFQVREALECLAVRLAVARVDSGTAVVLRSIVERMEAAVSMGDYVQANALHRNFHLELARASGNAPLVRVLEDIQDHINLSQATARSGPARFEQLTTEHLEIIRALAAGDAVRAESLVSEHIRRGLAATLAELSQAGEVGS